MNEQLLPEEISDEINTNLNSNNNNDTNNNNDNDNFFLKEKHSQEMSENPINYSNSFSKIIIPYNFQKNNYSIPEKSLDNYSGKDYILNTLYDLNLKTLFKFDSPYSPSFVEMIFVNVPMLIILIIITYFLFILVSIFLLNPITLYFAYKCLSKVFGIMSMVKKTMYEKYKKNAMRKILNEKNKSNYCQDNKVRWELGLSNYWLELVKIQ